MKKKLTHVTGAPVADKQNTLTAGKRGPTLLQDVWLIEKLAHFDREVILERRMHAKGSGLTAHLLKFSLTKRAQMGRILTNSKLQYNIAV